jgi:hypothetical protein
MRSRWYRTTVTTAVLMTASLLVAGSALAATITSYSPTTTFIPEVSGNCVGTSVTINGTGFVNDGGTPAVAFGGVPAVDVTVGSDKVIYAKPAAATVAGNITVTTPAGVATAPTPFTIFPCAATSGPTIFATTSSSAAATPAVSSFAPAKAKAGATVTIKGTGFTGATAVAFGGVKATTFKVVSSSKVTATVPAKAKTGKISVTTPTGVLTSAKAFTKL